MKAVEQETRTRISELLIDVPLSIILMTLFYYYIFGTSLSESIYNGILLTVSIKLIAEPLLKKRDVWFEKRDKRRGKQ